MQLQGKSMIITLCVCAACFCLFQYTYAVKSQSPTTYYQEKISLFEKLPKTKFDIVFVGDSLTDNIAWQELFPQLKVANRGIQGDSTGGVYQRIQNINDTEANKVFLMIGINDIMRGYSVANTFSNIESIIAKLLIHHQHIYIQSVLYTLDKRKVINVKVKQLNTLIQNYVSKKNNVTYIDLNHHLSLNGELNQTYTLDGIHLTGDGYIKWKSALKEHIVP